MPNSEASIREFLELDSEAVLPEPRRGIVMRYVWALCIVGLAILLRFCLEPYLEKSGFAVFLIAVLLVGWICGIGPCLIGQTLILAADVAWFKHSRDHTGRSVLQAVVSVSLYYLVGVLVGSLSHFWHSAKRKAEAQRRRAQRQSERLAAVLSCLDDAVLVSDDSGKLVLMNPAAERITGFQFADSRGKPLHEVFSLRDERSGQFLENPVDQVQRHKRPVHDTAASVLLTKTGAAVPVAYTAAPIYDIDGGHNGVVVALHDETQRRRAVEALRAADQRKDEFLATLGHELRNPLAPIRMGLDLLKLSGELSDETAEVRQMMERQCQQMVRLIDDLLDVSRITRGKLVLRKEYVNISDVVQNAIDCVRPAIEEGGHRLSVELPSHPVRLFADGQRLAQVLSNLLNNAAKYSPPSGNIELVAQQQAMETVFTVTDTGIGIPADKCHFIFEMFAQIKETPDAPTAGLGIGLTLVKRLVELHGGSVMAFSEGPNCGARFEVRIPLSADAAAIDQRPTVNNSPFQRVAKRRVLVVDDNADSRKTLTLMLRSLGHEVETAEDGVEAIAAAAKRRPQVVLMDLGMPRMDGYEAAKRIRQEPWGREILLVAVTGWGQEDDRRRTRQAGFDQHFVKPLELNQLRTLFDSIPAPLQPIAVQSAVNLATAHDRTSSPADERWQRVAEANR